MNNKNRPKIKYHKIYNIMLNWDKNIYNVYKTLVKKIKSIIKFKSLIIFCLILIVFIIIILNQLVFHKDLFLLLKYKNSSIWISSTLSFFTLLFALLKSIKKKSKLGSEILISRRRIILQITTLNNITPSIRIKRLSIGLLRKTSFYSEISDFEIGREYGFGELKKWRNFEGNLINIDILERKSGGFNVKHMINKLFNINNHDKTNYNDLFLCIEFESNDNPSITYSKYCKLLEII